ncbi:MAG TPA: hypothetical protein DDZ78_00240 [Porphyromonadaceae bacterium]|nr:hypothetical protein [Porphyromonadaceae bacterium]
MNESEFFISRVIGLLRTCFLEAGRLTAGTANLRKITDIFWPTKSFFILPNDTFARQSIKIKLVFNQYFIVIACKVFIYMYLKYT